jgi:hypothetical protein
MSKEGASIHLELNPEHEPEWWTIHEVRVLGPASAAGEQ